jgi:DNA-binding NtrC family response regulator
MEKRKTRVLFADDEPGIRITLPLILEQEGFDVSVAATVAEALALINREQFDVLLADLNIGERGDGFTLISAMRRVQPEAITLILTGYPDFESALQAIRSQVDDYLTKPADIKQLVKTIKKKFKQRIAIEARLLHSVVSRVLYKHLLSIDMSTCISDMMQMGESLHEQFEESIRAFEEQSGQSQIA